jgi:alpha-glucosidase
MKVIGLPFKPSKVLVDNKQIIETTIDELERYRFKANKNFRMIQIFK